MCVCVSVCARHFQFRVENYTLKFHYVLIASYSLVTSLGHRSLITISPQQRACAMTSRMAQTDAGAKLSYFRKINTFITTDGGLKLLDIFYMYF